MVALVKHDLQHILKQIRIAERHAAGEDLLTLVAGAALGTTQATPQLLPLGLRTVDGTYNNLMPGMTSTGAANGLMPRMLRPVFSNDADGDRMPLGPGPTAPVVSNTNYAVVGNVADANPRIISNLVTDQSLANKAAIVAALTTAGSTDPWGVAEQIHLAYRDLRSAAPSDQAGKQAVLDFMLGTNGLKVEGNSVLVLNVATDGASAPYNSFFTIFGQFFDHGLDLIDKGGSGKVYMPLQPDDPLYVPGGRSNFMVLTRATNQPGPDGIVGTADDVRETVNRTTPWIDLNQVYTSHASHQVFLREYVMRDGRPYATGKMLEGAAGGPPNWADVKAQALSMLGIRLSDTDVARVPMLATDAYGNFIPGASGLPQLVLAGPPQVLVEGNLASPISTAGAVATGVVFLADIAHDSDPGAGLPADADTLTGNAQARDQRGTRLTYDDEMLARHFIVGDGRGNENIALTAVHTVFHSEHNHRIDQAKEVLIASALEGDIAFLNEWLKQPVQSVPADLGTLVWDGERLFQAARFSTEMVYQHLVFEQFARGISPTIDPFVFSNNPDIDPAITAEFAHVVYRFGHSMLNETVERVSIDGSLSDPIGLIQAFLNPVEFNLLGGQQVDARTAAGALIRGMSLQVGNEIDEHITDALRNNLVGLPLDLGALNIARGRETGVPTLNEARRQFFEATNDSTLKPYDNWTHFAQFLKNPASIVNFIAAYGTHASVTGAVTLEAKREAAEALVFGGDGAPADRLDFLNARGAYAGGSLGGLNTVDFWVGGLAEMKVPFGGMLGTTFNYVFEVQMEKLQAGDRFYYLSRTQGLNLLNELEADSFGALVYRNTDIGQIGSTHVAANLFATPDLTIETDLARQTDYDVNGQSASGKDPVHANPILNTIRPLVIRSDGDGNLANGLENVQYTSDLHIVLGGTEANNVLTAGAGDDTVWGDGGNDRLEGGLGNDHLFGGKGDDIITDAGSDVGDVIEGGEGNDVISGGNGLDLLFGSAGNDFVFGSQDDKDITGGLGDDFIQGGTGSNFLKGSEGSDWIEGGDGSAGFDGLAGENSELFFNSTIIGHDVLNGRGGDSDYDGESGDDIMVQGSGVQRSNGMAGFDWATHKGDALAASSDLGIPIFATQQNFILRDRFDLVEGLSGWNLNDTLTGRDVLLGIAGAAGGVGVPAIITDPTSPYLSYSNALTQEGVDRIAGLSAIVSHLGTETFTVAGERHTVRVFDQASVVRNAAGAATFVHDTPADILLGGGGADVITGKDGNDIIDGDRWLNTRIGIVRNGVEIATADGMSTSVTDLAGNVLHGGRSLSALMIDRVYAAGELKIVRELLDGDAANTAVDVAVYRGQVTEYDFFRHADGSLTVAHARPRIAGGNDGVDRLHNIEALQFAAPVGLNTLGIQQLQLNRAPVVAVNVETNLRMAENTTGLLATAQFVDPNTGALILNFNAAGQASVVQAAPLTLSLGGADARYFSIDPLGQLRLNSALNFEQRTDFNQDGIYSVSVIASDGLLSTSQEFSLTITNVNEAPAGQISVTGATVLGGTLIVASTLLDPDGNGPITWGWRANGIDIAGATGAAYVLSANDVGKSITAVARYTDGGGFFNEVVSAATAPVLAEITGTAGNDTLNGNAANNVMRGLAGIDTLNGLAGNDSLFGGDGNDILNGGDGNDFLDGGAGSDRLTGGAGDDTYVYDAADAIVEAANGGADTLQVALASFTLSVANVENLSFIGVGNFTGTGSTGNNVITGGAGNDVLSGAAGNDTLLGGAGADTLIGGAGVDRFTGGAGADVFRLGAVTESGLTAALRDVITDFQKGVDRIDLSIIDANASTTLNDAFAFRGTTAIGGLGQMNMAYDAATNTTVISANVTGTTAAEFTLALLGNYTSGVNALTATDFVL